MKPKFNLNIYTSLTLDQREAGVMSLLSLSIDLKLETTAARFARASSSTDLFSGTTLKQNKISELQEKGTNKNMNV